MMHGTLTREVKVQTNFAVGKEKFAEPLHITQPFTTAIIDPDWPYTVGPKGKRSGYTRYKDSERNIYKQDEPLTIDELKDLPVGELVGGYLFMWTVGPFLIHPNPKKQALSVLEAWGFKQASILTWAKWNRKRNAGYGGVGSWFLGNAEFCIVAKRKGFPSVRTGRSSLIVEPKTKHSAKPDNIHELCEQRFPGPFLEIFGRKNRKGWAVIGNEAPDTEGQDIRESMRRLLQ